MEDNFFGITDVGSVRGNNEDTFIAKQTADSKMIIACVIDGVGGYSGGEVAAEIARKTIANHLERPSGDIIPNMLEALHQANKKIWEAKQENKEYESMACVLTLALVDTDSNQFHYAHVGDTRLYLLRDGSLVKISSDHSFVGFLEDSGRLTEEAAMNHPKRNEINKALGFDNMIGNQDDYIETGQSPFLPGDMLLLCSDGLTDMVDKSTITSILISRDSLKSKGSQLIKAAIKNGGNDNVTVVLVENNKKPLTQDATKPLAKAQPAADVKINNPVPILPNEPKKETFEPENKKSGLVALLTILCMVFLATSAWLYLNRSPQKTTDIKKPDTVAAKPNALEVKLQTAINNDKVKDLILSDTAYSQTIKLTRPIIIEKDTLYIKSKGKILFEADSTLKGAGFVISPKCKFIVLDSLNFKGFNVAISSVNNILYLKNARFFNCQIPLQNSLTFGNGKVSGRLPSTAFKTDTSSLKSAQ